MTGALAVCAGPVYAGGNPLLPCGTILVGDVAVFGTPQDDPASTCDPIDPPDNVLRYRVALPPGYEDDTERRWPVVYLLPGGGGDEHAWETNTEVVPKIAALGTIVVLPYGGLTFHVDWEVGERRAYERAFVERLVPAVDAEYRTLTNREHRAIAGFSRGGYGAMLTAARHPDLFGAAAAFSGVLDVFGDVRSEQLYLVAATVGDTPWYGDPITNELGWRERNPLDLALALRGTHLWMSSGNGVPDDDDVIDPFTALNSFAEFQIMRGTQRLSSELDRLGIPHHRDVHAGVHNYGNAGTDALRWARRWVEKGFGLPAPATFSLRNADPSFGAYDWTFRADPARAPEFLDVTGVGPAGFRLAGSGATTVVTPALYASGQAVDVVVDGKARRVTAGPDGRLEFVVQLGNPNAQQQFTPAAIGQGRAVRTVRLRPA